MEKLIDLISGQVCQAFADAGYDAELGRVSLSVRPDLCEYQCNGCMKAAKLYHKAPIMIAKDVAAKLEGNDWFSTVEVANPGFINLRLLPEKVAAYLNEMQNSEKFGLQTENPPKTVVIDYGGANVAKPLHVGHIRPAVIGEAVKRIEKYFGNHVIGDTHLGDWGLQMGLIIEQVHDEQPNLPYFDPDFTGEYPTEAPFTIAELENIYPTASARSKKEAEFSNRAHEATVKLQKGDRGYTALWHQIMKVSLADLKKNYDDLNVFFELWKGESDAEPYIADMVQMMKDKGFAIESQGALVVEVQEPDDKIEVPPCIILKSDGATLYATTDLATLVQREADFHPDKVLYVVDKRQDMHFRQVFRTAYKTGIIRPETKLEFLGFGTMNGADGKPFKTRSGGVMRLEMLMENIRETIEQNSTLTNVSEDQRLETTKKIAVAALKYGDLSNLATKDYVFDIERFSAVEGNTGPYILYSIIRIRSILNKYVERFGALPAALTILPPQDRIQKDLMLQIARFSEYLTQAYTETQPNILCAYIHDLAVLVNRFYHETHILTEENQEVREGYIALITLAKNLLEASIDMLGFEAPEQM